MAQNAERKPVLSHRIPCFGPPPEPGCRYQRRPGAYAILSVGRRMLLTVQQEPGPEYQLPGGGIDAGESAQTALHREAFEETGWSIGRLRRLGAYRRFCYMPEYDLWAEKLCHVWLARPILRLGQPSEANHRAVWADLREAPTLVADPGSVFFLRRLIGGR